MKCHGTVKQDENLEVTWIQQLKNPFLLLLKSTKFIFFRAFASFFSASICLHTLLLIIKFLTHCPFSVSLLSPPNHNQPPCPQSLSLISVNKYFSTHYVPPTYTKEKPCPLSALYSVTSCYLYFLVRILHSLKILFFICLLAFSVNENNNLVFLIHHHIFST